MKRDNHYDPERMLRRAGLRCTQPRLTVLKVLAAAVRPLSPEEVVRKLGTEGPNRVTVYRVLESLVRCGLVHRAFTGQRAGRYELAVNCGQKQCHPHFTCTVCGRTICIKKFSLPIVKGLGDGFVVQRQQVRLEGICPRCG